MQVAESLTLSVSDLIGKSIAVLGSTGTGKTNTTAVLIEELAPHVPMTIVDQESEYWGLRERLPVLIVGRSEHADLAVTPEDAPRLAEMVMEQRVSVILDLLEYSDAEKSTFLLGYFTRLWELSLKARTPHCIVLEEAHELIPQGIRTPLKEILTRIALRGRKRGLGIILASQRTAKVEKDVLSQAAMFFLHKVFYPIDVKVYQELLPLKPAESEPMIHGLQTGQAIFLHQHETQVVNVRRRHTFHVGATPDLQTDKAPTLASIDVGLLEKLRVALETPAPAPVQNVPDNRDAVIAELRVQLAEKEAIINELKAKAQPVPPKPVQMSLMTIVEEANGDYRSPMATARALKQQKRQFDRLVDDLHVLPRWQRIILSYLIIHEGQWFPRKTLARFTGLSEVTIKSHPPTELIRLKLLRREGTRGDQVFSSGAREMLRERFPDLNVNDLIDRLVALDPAAKVS